MYLSKVMVHWKWAENPYKLHKALWQLFPDRDGQKRDFQFRVEQYQKGIGALVLLQSELEPINADVAMIMASKSFKPNIETGSTIRFKLRANPVKTIKDKHGRLTKKGEPKKCRVPLLREEDKINWLQRKLEGKATLQSIQVQDEKPLYFYKESEDRRGQIKPVCFEGVLSIDNAEAFSQMLQTGIGAAKGMGCGMLSLAPVG